MVVTPNFSLGTVGNDDDLVMDQTRLIQGIVGGIGFLGAGAIMNKEESGRLRGVSSGAAIWGAGEIGVACGLGYLKEAAFITALIFAILNLYGWVQRLFEKPDKPQGDDEQSSTENS